MSDEKKSITYADAGVNIDAGNKAVELMKDSVRATYRPEVIGDLGGFGGLLPWVPTRILFLYPALMAWVPSSRLPSSWTVMTPSARMQSPCVSMISLSRSGTALFLDYIATAKVDSQKIADIVRGVAGACKESGCALIGGETAEMAGFYAKDEYDIAGFSVGVVERDKMITGDKVKAGDVLLGLPSTGIHSNGYSLVRKLCFDVMGMKVDTYIPEFGKTLGEELLTPTRLYPRTCLPLIKKFDLHGMVHITGGGFYENIPRILPADCDAEVHADAWEMPAVFKKLQEWGNVP